MVDRRSSIVDHRSSMSRSNPLVALPHMALLRALATCALLAAAACGGSSLVLQSPDGSTSPADDGSVDGMVTDAGVDAPDPCGPTNCQGCCRSDGTCNTVTSVAACGAEGSACTACGAADSCNKPAQGCISNYNAPCTPQNCPTGCCFAYGASQYCAQGTFSTGCGHGGQACNICGVGGCTPEDGGGGSCANQPLCSPTTCNGCCFQGVCAVGRQDIACGFGGATCLDCTTLGAACNVNGYCK